MEPTPIARAVPELHRAFTFAELRPEPHLVATVLGYPAGELPEVARDAVEAVASRGEALWSIQGGFVLSSGARVDGSTLRLEKGGLAFDVGKTVGGQLARATAVAAFLCTAGKGIEELSRGLMAGGDPFTGFVADALGSLVVEAAVDRLQDALEVRLAARGLHITNRYSPGYCQWHVSDQRQLFR